MVTGDFGIWLGKIKWIAGWVLNIYDFFFPFALPWVLKMNLNRYWWAARSKLQRGTVIMNVGRGTRESDAQKLSSLSKLAQLFFLSACSEPLWKMCVCLYHMCAVCCSFMFILNRGSHKDICVMVLHKWRIITVESRLVLNEISIKWCHQKYKTSWK